MPDRLKKYRSGNKHLAKTYQAWELYGTGFENLGKDDTPAELPLPKPAPDEMLARVDAVGLCMSDIKVIKLGADHPRLTGRNLVEEPVVPGHEVAITLVEVGEKLQDRFQVGQRFLIQADVFYKKQSIAFGYNLRGGAAQYTIINHYLYAGDAGSYLLPIADATGYSQAALSEPWACVEASYHIKSRRAPKPRGVTWVIGVCGGDLGNYSLGEGFGGQNGPRLVVTTDLTGPVADDLRKYAFTSGAMLEESATLKLALPKFESNGKRTFDDIIIIGKPRAGMIDHVSKLLNKSGHLALVCPDSVGMKEEIDIGRIHYDFLHFCGTSSTVVMNAYKSKRHSSALVSAGTAWIIGAGGPMGQMHLQRALEQKNGPRVVLATDPDEARIQFVKERFTSLAEERGRQLLCVNATALTPHMIETITNGDGFTDIVLTAPVPALAEEAWKRLATDGMLNIFGGFARGTKAKLSIAPFCVRGCRIAGSSGSGLDDLRFMLSESESGRLATDKAVAAIGGIMALKEGLCGVDQRRFPGKVVIYPHLDFPLLSLPELGEYFPTVAGKLEAGKFWNRDAEAELFKQLLA